MFYEDLALLSETFNLTGHKPASRHLSDENDGISEEVPALNTLPRNRYFVKQGYCLLTSKVPASAELNKINIYLRKASVNGHMYRQFEDYVARLLFEVPLPLHNTKLKLYLPPGNIAPPNAPTSSIDIASQVVEIY